MSAAEDRASATAWIMGGTAVIVGLIGWAAAPSWERDHLGDVLVGIVAIAALAILAVIGATCWIVQSHRDGWRRPTSTSTTVHHHHTTTERVVVVLDPRTGRYRELDPTEAARIELPSGAP